MRAVVVALVGPSASGKTTVSRLLARRLRGRWLDEAFYRLRPTPSLTWSSEGGLWRLERSLLEEEARRSAEALASAESGIPVVADTGFLDPVTYTAGLGVLGLADPATVRRLFERAHELAGAGALGLPDLTVRLATTAAVRRARAAADPEHHPPALRARHEAVGRVERGPIAHALRAALPGRLRTVAAGGPPAEVAARIASSVGAVLPLPDPCRAAGVALEAVRRATVRRGAREGNLKRGTLSPRPPR